jgi:hypothetical protein
MTRDDWDGILDVLAAGDFPNRHASKRVSFWFGYDLGDPGDVLFRVRMEAVGAFNRRTWARSNRPTRRRRAA